MTQDADKKPQWEFFRGQWDWGGLFQAMITGGPGAIFIALLIPLLVVAECIRIFLHAVSLFPKVFAVGDMILALVGFAAFSTAKVSAFRQGHFFTFGSSPMTHRNRILYRWGYILILCSAAIAIAFILIDKTGKV